jgi:salicylate hydroxylase
VKALVVGGGIGGVTAALCLHAVGIDVELFERSDALKQVGAGIQLSPNGMKVLARLGLDAAVASVAFRPEALGMRLGRSGTTIFSIPMGAGAEQRYGAPYLHVHRADLMAVLAAALDERAPAALHTGRTLVSVEQDTQGVTARFTDGSTATGDVLIGADGIHSQVQATLFGQSPARFTGNVAWRLVVPADDRLRALVPPWATIWVGPGRHAVTYWLRRGELLNFVGIVEQDGWQKEGWTEPGDVADLRRDFEFWAEPVTEIITRATSCHRWALFDRDPLERWGEGRVTLLGDACHPMLPFLAQGAVMAIEDAFVLARSLASQSAVPDALRAYEATRRPRTARVQQAARAQMGRYHQRTLLGQLATYTPMWLAARLAPAQVRSMQDWLYTVDVTA